MLGQYLTDWFSLLRVGDTRPIVLGSWTEAPPRPNSGTGFLFGLRGCRRTTSITSSTPPAGMSSSIGKPRRSAALRGRTIINRFFENCDDKGGLGQ